MKADRKTIILSKIKDSILKEAPDAKIFLYGSRARNDEDVLSDWDILILLNHSKITSSIERKIAYPLYDIEFETGEIISPMIYAESEWESKYKVTPFYQNVMNDKMEL